ncbi:MAG: Na+:solute symporter [Deltaproteobacteria bacterium]|nr:Na+:solute symporter [Deltaproteobacteria bacterium]
MQLQLIDWGIVAGYLVFSVLIGILYTRAASRSMVSYFAADRSIGWVMLGVSMVATTFASDTPLAVTGIVAREGISGNWFWWSLALCHLLVVFVVSRLWRKSEVITDAELIELRYDGKAATTLRAFKAFFFAIVINCITLGWVIRAVGKIFGAFVRWEAIAPDLYSSMASWWPRGITISDPGEGLSILIVTGITVVYAMMGGLRSVIVTDVFQFVLAMGGAILLAVFAVDHVGGLDSLVTQLRTLYPGEAADGILAFFPQGLAGGALFSFVVYVTIQWWSTHASDGGGYFMQRMTAARNEDEAYKGVLLFTILHYLVRTWPWVLVGLVALVVYPLVPPEGVVPAADYARVLADREAAYPVLIGRLLPPGLIGLMLASLMAAFMSTVTTHINWGASYLVNDVYRRFLRQDASERELVAAGWTATFLMTVLGLAITTRVDSVKSAWEFFTALGAGLGLPHLLRWVWWRVNAWSELTGLATAAACTALLWGLAPELAYPWKLTLTVAASASTMMAATFLAPAVGREHLARFYARVRPFGFWGPLSEPGVQAAARRQLARTLALWGLSCAVMLLSMWTLHQLFVGHRLTGAVLVPVCVAGWGLVLRRESAPHA